MNSLSTPWKQGFLYGQYAENFEEEWELVRDSKIPYAAGTTEYDEWLDGYLHNLS